MKTVTTWTISHANLSHLYSTDVPIRRGSPVTAAEAQAALTTLEAGLSKPQRKNRSRSFQAARQFISRAAAAGGVGVSSRSFTGTDPKGGIRVDVEIMEGPINLVPLDVQ